ncbi:alpha/beta-Hydrolases superfamily protein [Euphorbia peplus]|nr:alpha/beta-Hydrolases superfamily protein [Euphorbia peplus]
MATSSKLLNTIIFYLSSALKFIFTLNFNPPKLLFILTDTLFSLYYRFHGLQPITIDLDPETTLHFWVSGHRRFNKPNLLLIHGFGGDSRWQFLFQFPSLAKKFNLILPDLLFFGKSYSARSDRGFGFQAECLARGLKRLGVERFSVYSISYGGYVAYRMAEICQEEMEKLVIVSSGVGWSDDDEIVDQIRKAGKDPMEILLPSNPQDLRLLVRLSTFKGDPLRFLPDFFLQEFINAMNNHRRKEKVGLLEHLLSKKEEAKLSILTQETLLIWGDQDNIFPVFLAHRLHRHLGPKSRVEIIKDAGHAANIESPDALNNLITSFILGVQS